LKSKSNKGLSLFEVGGYVQKVPSESSSDFGAVDMLFSVKVAGDPT